MLELDGSGGGGQLVRTALSLAAVSGRGFEMRGIRQQRPNPGLRPQHLAAVRVIADVTGAEVAGATEGSETLEFRPGPVQPGEYAVDVGTAGSLTLLFDAVLPLTHGLGGALTLSAHGGTDVRWAPTMDYFRRVKLPLLRRCGVPVGVDVTRRGFYPAGGGEATLVLAGSSPGPLSLESPGGPAAARVYSVATKGLAESDVAERQADAARRELEAADVEVVDRVSAYVSARSPGSAIAIRLDRGELIAGADALDRLGAEELQLHAAADAADQRILGQAED